MFTSEVERKQTLVYIIILNVKIKIMQCPLVVRPFTFQIPKLSEINNM